MIVFGFYKIPWQHFELMEIFFIFYIMHLFENSAVISIIVPMDVNDSKAKRKKYARIAENGALTYTSSSCHIFYLNKYHEMYHFITENRLNVHCDATWLRFVLKRFSKERHSRIKRSGKCSWQYWKKKQFKFFVEKFSGIFPSLPLLYGIRNSLLSHACSRNHRSTINHRRMKI